MSANGSGIMRFAKLKTFEEITRVLNHIYRDQFPSNADVNKSAMNEVLTSKIGKCAKDSMQRIRKRIELMDKKPRSNSVLAVEFIFTASPDAMLSLSAEERKQYFLKSLRWVADKVGVENVINATIHRDETTDHCHVIILPIPVGENHLNCRAILGGHKSKASDLQDDFYKKVSSKFGFGRGVKGSKAKHQSLSEYHKLVNDSLPKLRTEKLELEVQCNALEEKISKGNLILDSIKFDIKKILEEHSNALKYCLTALKERLMDRWGMQYEGNNQFKFQADEYIQEVDDPAKKVEEPPKYDVERPRLRMR